MPVLALELIVIFAAPDSHLPASVWMGLAAIICEKTKRGEGQIALKRLLNSSSAKLASTVVDGVWKDGLYPKSGETDIAAGLVWLTLGSPSAAIVEGRPQHPLLRAVSKVGSNRCAHRRFHSTDAHPYQAPELPFYFLHARLWLLIAIARVAMDHPQNVAKYADALKAIALDKSAPHVLMRHFAAQALLVCASERQHCPVGGGCQGAEEGQRVALPEGKRRSNTSAIHFTRSVRARCRSQGPNSTWTTISTNTDVTKVSDMFDRSRWETQDAITAWVRKYDPQITSMYESGGRPVRQRDRIRGMAGAVSPLWTTTGMARTLPGGRRVPGEVSGRSAPIR